MARSYYSSWSDTVCGAVRSYIDVVRKLKEAKKYTPDIRYGMSDREPKSPMTSIRIPLLWGTF